jgi:hypothetical protein
MFFLSELLRSSTVKKKKKKEEKRYRDCEIIDSHRGYGKD